MAQRHQWQSGGSEQVLAERAWLASLIETFETVSRHPTKPCNPAAIAALKTQLSRPPAAMAVSFIAVH